MKTFEQLSDDIYNAFSPRVPFTLICERRPVGKDALYKVKLKTKFYLCGGRTLSQEAESGVSYACSLQEIFIKTKKQIALYKADMRLGSDEYALLSEIEEKFSKIA